jgi:hypothetical protein
MSLKRGTWFLHLEMLSFVVSFAFLCAIYALLLIKSELPIMFRYESSVDVLMRQTDMVAPLAPTLPSPKGKVLSTYVWYGLAIYASHSTTFVAYNFIISSIAVEGFKSLPSDYGRKITDQDFGLTLTQAILCVLEDNAQYYGDFGWVVGYDNEFVHDKLYDVNDGLFRQERAQHASFGVAMDISALILVVSMMLIAIVGRS